MKIGRLRPLGIAIVVFGTPGCVDDDVLSGTCPTVCYTGAPSTIGVGACRAGTPICDETFEIVECVGDVTPSEEICDGVDNDCDGTVDGMQLRAVHMPAAEYPCLTAGICSESYTQCNNGNWDCVYPPTAEPGGETRCDGLDNDCDGVTDEDLFTGEFCYTGVIGSELIAPCHPGVMQCSDGQVICVNQVVPSAEFCDGVDNNCNGLVDDVDFETPVAFDIVFAIDTSVSMRLELEAVLDALGQYIDQFVTETDIRFAIVDIAERNPEHFEVVSDFADIATIHQRLLTISLDGGDEEASLDAAFALCDSRATGALALSWNPDAHGILLGFTDESPQSYTLPQTTQNDVIDRCNSYDVTIYQWSYSGEEFSPMTDGTGGRNFVLTPDAATMFDELSAILGSLCTDVP